MPRFCSICVIISFVSVLNLLVHCRYISYILLVPRSSPGLNLHLQSTPPPFLPCSNLSQISHLILHLHHLLSRVLLQHPSLVNALRLGWLFQPIKNSYKAVDFSSYN